MYRYIFSIPIITSLLAFVFVLFLVEEIKRVPTGSEKMREISKSIAEGAATFLKRESGAMLILFIVLALVLMWLFNWKHALAFLWGGFTSGLAGYLGMLIATRTNVRTSASATKSFSKAFSVAYKGGTVMGMLVVGLGLLGLTITWFLFKDAQILVRYAFGCSLIALFMRFGGGIYTKSADIGADLVGKVEEKLPEDDSRNPAVIADQVGDNVGDIAGMGSDLFESYVSAIAATAILGVSLYGLKGIIYPLILASAGILSSIIGNFFVHVNKNYSSNFEKQNKGARKAMTNGILVANILMFVSAYFITRVVLGQISVFWALVTGLVVGLLISKSSEYYTSDQYGPVKSIVKSCQAGPSINILEGYSQGLFSSLIPVLSVAIGTIISFRLAGFLGIAVSALGILVVLGINLSSDCYGPIADNAAGISEMSGLPPEVRERTDALDSVGNTTAAMGKGFSIGSAGLAALAWLAAFFQVAHLKVVSLTDPGVVAGLFIGASLSFLFSALAIKAVSQGSFAIVKEVRRQFREIPGLLEGKAKPDYSKCVDITTKRALRSMILPGTLAIISPFLVGFLGLRTLGGFLAGALVSGFILAISMANSGGAWDNAKKYVETEKVYDKTSEAYAAAVAGDTVGDPFKDTAGPSLNILIKLMGEISLILAPIFLTILK